jgi:hypothetical protein
MCMVFADAVNIFGKIIGGGIKNIFFDTFNKLNYIVQLAYIFGFYFLIYYLVMGLCHLYLHS